MFCPQCGAPNEDDAIFCGNCGAVLDSDAVPAEAELEAPDQVPAEEYQEPVEAPEGPVDEPLPQEELALDVPPPPPPPPPPPSPPAPSMPTSGLAIASLVLGIGGLTVLPLFGSILAIIFGYMARRDIRQRPGTVTGEGLAMAGIVLGWISVGLAVIGLAVFGAFAMCGMCGALGGGGY